MAKWIGYAVSVNCGEPLGCYQGTIFEADGSTITLTKAFRNGFPYPKAQVTLSAADIKELKIIEVRSEPAEQTHSTVPVTKNNKKGPRATVCENLQANPTSSGGQLSQGAGSSNKAQTPRGAGPSSAPVRSKPIDIQGGKNKSNNNNTHAGSYSNTSSTPKGRSAGGGGGSGGGGSAGAGGGYDKAGGGGYDKAGAGGGGYEKARRRNEACFGETAEIALDDDFDFEGNLALFDKRALWESMRNSKPDLVRQADEAGGKLRHDENVLGGGGAGPGVARRGIRVPDELRGPFDYVTDDALVVPSVVPRLRRQLWEGMERVGLAECGRTLVARGAADVCLRLVGGGRRLQPGNAHQTPVVVLLGAKPAGLRCLRLLASHGAKAALHLAGGESTCASGRAELAALALSGVRPLPLERLPSPDLVVLALQDERGDAAGDTDDRLPALAWARAARAACVAIEPPAMGWGCGSSEGPVRCRASVVGLLPGALAGCLGRVYLVDAAPPPSLFRDLRLQYRPPFGAGPLLPLHVADAHDLTDPALHSH